MADDYAASLLNYASGVNASTADTYRQIAANNSRITEGQMRGIQEEQQQQQRGQIEAKLQQQRVAQQAEAQERKLTQAEVLRKQRLEQGQSTLDAELAAARITPNEYGNLSLRLKTGLDPLRERAAASAAKDKEQHFKMLEEQTKRQASLQKQTDEFFAADLNNLAQPIYQGPNKTDPIINPMTGKPARYYRTPKGIITRLDEGERPTPPPKPPKAMSVEEMTDEADRIAAKQIGQEMKDAGRGQERIDYEAANFKTRSATIYEKIQADQNAAQAGISRPDQIAAPVGGDFGDGDFGDGGQTQAKPTAPYQAAEQTAQQRPAPAKEPQPPYQPGSPATQSQKESVAELEVMRSRIDNVPEVSRPAMTAAAAKAKSLLAAHGSVEAMLPPAKEEFAAALRLLASAPVGKPAAYSTYNNPYQRREPMAGY